MENKDFFDYLDDAFSYSAILFASAVVLFYPMAWAFNKIFYNNDVEYSEDEISFTKAYGALGERQLTVHKDGEI